MRRLPSTGFLGRAVAESRARADRLDPAELRAAVRDAAPATSLRAALSVPGRRIVAEIKRASPSRGTIRADLRADALAGAYAAGGAAAISVLTEPNHFRGSLDDLRGAARAVALPVLRKDFLVDPRQPFEARAAGADAVLLIAAALPGDDLRRMAEAAAEAGVETLVEVHDEPELERALATGAPIVGVNARDLCTLAVDLAVVERLAGSMPRGVIGVAESGIQGVDEIVRLERAGYRAFLVGESLVRAEDPAAALRRLLA